jgi:hypothetical protein
MKIKSPADIIGSAVADIDSHINTAKQTRALLKSGKVRTMLNKLLEPLVYAVGSAGTVQVWISGGMPFIHVYMYRLESFKQSQLMAALEYLHDKTAALDGNVNCEDYAAAINRDYRFTTTKWTANISAYVKDDSPTCRKVVVGTKMVEQVQYEISCD